MNLPRPLRGIVTPLVTPLKKGPVIDGDGLERLLEHVIGGGVHALFILGTSGEGPALPYRARAELMQLALKRVRGRVPVLVGITDTSYEDALRMARVAHESGAAAVVAAPPFYYRVSQGDLFDYYVRLAADAPLPLFLYNAPLNTPQVLEVPMVAKAAAVPNIAGLKDSGSSMSYFLLAQEATRAFPAFSRLIGPEDLMAQAVLMGAHGGISGGSNVWPQLFVSLYEAAAAGDVSRVNQLEKHVLRLDSLLYRSVEGAVNPLRGLKCALSLMGLCGDEMTTPLRPFSKAERAEVEQYLDTIDLSTAPPMSRPAP